MQRLLRGAIALVLIALPIAAQAQLEIQAFSTQELLSSPPPEGYPRIPSGFEPGLGFGLTRHFVTAIAASPVDGDGVPIEGEPLEVTFYSVPTELWFLGNSSSGDLELIGISEDSTLRHRINLTDIGLGGINPDSRLGIIETGDAESIATTIFMTDPWAHGVHALTISGEVSVDDPPATVGNEATQEATFFRPNDVDLLNFTGDPLEARALADLGRGLLPTQPQLPDVLQLLEDELLENGDTFYLKLFDSETVMALDAESQPNPEFGDLPTAAYSDEIVAALDTRARMQQIRSANTDAPQGRNSTLLSAFFGSRVSGPNNPVAAFYPVGVASTASQPSSEFFFVVREGGLLDTVYSSFPLEEGSELPGPPTPLLTNWHLNPQYPLRIQDIAVDGFFFLWIRTEKVVDPDGNQILPDLYRINLLTSQWPGPAPAPGNPIDRADVNGDGVHNAQDLVVMTNFLSGGGVPQVDPVLWRRYDADADNQFTLADTEAVVTQPLIFQDEPTGVPRFGVSDQFFQSDPTYYSVFPLADNVYDVEVVDVNADSLPDYSFLTRFENGTTVLRIILGDGKVTPLVEPGITMFEIPLGFSARNMTWFNANGDDRIDLAMISAGNTPGQLQIATNFTPIDGPVVLTFGGLTDAGPNPLDIAHGDFDEDGWDDLVISNSADEDNLQVLINEGGVFTRTIRTAQSVPRGLAAGELGTGGNADSLATAISLDSNLQIFTSRQGRTLLPLPSLFATLATPRDVVLGEFSLPTATQSQRLLDVAILNSGTANDKPVIQFFRNSGDSEFTPIADIQIPGFNDLIDAEAGDVNLSGYDDVVMVGRQTGIRIYRTNAALGPFASGGGAPGFSIPAIGGASMSDIEIADLDDDGDLDLVVGITGTPRIFPLYNGFMIWENRTVAPLNLFEEEQPPDEELLRP